MYRVGRIVCSDQTIRRLRRIDPITTRERSAVIDEVIAGYEVLMHSLAGGHAPEFLEIAITMPQAKVLYLLGAAGELHMSALVARLGVSLSTVSGLVDRLVDHGLARRREDAADRRQVVVDLTAAGTAFIDRFRELSVAEMRQLLVLLDDHELASVRHALGALARAAAIRAATPRTAQTPDPAVVSATVSTRKDRP
jgi:DNA-binding MarR family transcriptional regulator